MINIYVVSLEPIDTRYTAQWKTHIPKSLEAYAKKLGKDVNIVDIEGTLVENKVSPGAFLDFAATNIWKSSQLEKIAELFRDQKVKPGDIFLYTDFWNPSVIQLKYMSELLGIPVKIVGIAHAGSYDAQDFLGRLIGDAPWVRHAEKSFYHCFDKLIFATQFHLEMFANTLLDYQLWWEKLSPEDDAKLIRSGFPMEYFPGLLKPYSNLPKKDLILFPHRLAPEKQVNIFLDLAKEMPEYEWVVCQDKKLSKDEYHTLLGQSKILFSANLQETLGITTCAEGPLSGAIPLAPDRLSYTEIFKDHKEFLYPSEWTCDWVHYRACKPKLIKKIKYIMNNYNKMLDSVNDYNQTSFKNFFQPDIMFKELF